MIKKAAKWIVIGLLTMAGIFMLGNINNAFLQVSPDRITVSISREITLKSIADQLPGSSVLDEELGILFVPYGRTSESIQAIGNAKGVFRANYVHLNQPEISIRYYFYTLGKQIADYAHGDFGTVMTGSGHAVIPVSQAMWEMIPRTFRYFIPSMLTALAFSFALSLIASMRRGIGKLLDGVHGLLIAVPDFYLVTLITLAAIFSYKRFHVRLALVVQFGDQVPFLIPFLTIALIPGVMIYGTLRLAIQRELAQAYVLTAKSKGLSHGEVLFYHVLRNIVEDLLAVLPKATTAALASMAVAEAVCDILGLGGIIVSPRMQGVGMLPLACLTLAAVSMLFHGLYAWMRGKFVVRTREVA